MKIVRDRPNDNKPSVTISMTLGKQLRLRRVDTHDRERLWLWSNDPEVRINSFESRLIPWEEHCRWFAARLVDPRWRAWIGIDLADYPVGLVRFQILGTRAQISVNVAHEARRQGYGRALIEHGCIALFQELPLTAVDAFIKPDNIASLAVFRSAGFYEINAPTITQVGTCRSHHKPLESEGSRGFCDDCGCAL